MQRVLVADDSVTARKSIQQVLELAGIEVVAVGNGDLALARLDEVAPHMVLLDVVMPGRSGYEICRELKDHDRHARIPVMLVTGDSEPYDELEARRAGADGHLVKPLDSRAIAGMRAVWSRVSPKDVEGMAPENTEPESLLPPPDWRDGFAVANPDGSSTAGIDAYSTVSIPIPFFPPIVPIAPDVPQGGTMVVGFGGDGLFGAPGLPPAEAPAESEVEANTGADALPRSRPAPLSDAVIESLDEELTPPESEGSPARVPVATTETLESELDVDQAELVRTATEVGIRTAPTSALRLAHGRCPSCGFGLSGGDIFCLSCGAAVLLKGDGAEAPTDVVAANLCAECGHAVRPGEVFCVACGAVVS